MRPVAPSLLALLRSQTSAKTVLGARGLASCGGSKPTLSTPCPVWGTTREPPERKSRLTAAWCAQPLSSCPQRPAHNLRTSPTVPLDVPGRSIGAAVDGRGQQEQDHKCHQTVPQGQRQRGEAVGRPHRPTGGLERCRVPGQPLPSTCSASAGNPPRCCHCLGLSVTLTHSLPAMSTYIQVRAPGALGCAVLGRKRGAIVCSSG